ncbi:ankyrin repeat-containing domain protein [Xylariaceae sp. FL0594]|nr:ankyrin repeat-containing domain protein [Xylariaceae sp. FL0594]
MEDDPLGISSSQWRDLLDTKNLDDLATLFSLARRPSPLPIAGGLLVDAAETSQQEILDAMSAEMLSTLPVESVVRALAASQGAFHDKLKKKVDFLDEEAMSRARLTALVLGNNTERDSLIAEFSSPSSVVWQGGRRFAGVMSAALEYDDKVVIEKALELRDWDTISGGTDSLTTLDPNGWSTLHAAAELGRREVIQKILKSRHQDEIRALTPGPRGPVFIAASHGFGDVVELLLDAGMSVDDVDESPGRTALHIASALGCCHTVDVLLGRGPDVTLYDEAGDFPLHLAIRHRHQHIAEQLLNRFSIDHASPGIGDDDGTNIDLVFGDDDPTNFDMVFDAAINRANLKGVTILAEAAGQNMPELCAAALGRGASPNRVDGLKRTPLHGAAGIGSITMVRDLLSKGSVANQVAMDVDCIPYTTLVKRDIWDRTPLSAAAVAGHLDAVRLLYGHYDDLEMVQALVVAAQHDKRGVVEYLLDSGCPVDGAGKDASRLTPIVELDPGKNSMAMQILLARGAKPDERRRHDGQSNPIIYEAASQGAYEAVKLLLNCGANADAETLEGDTPLCIAIFWEHADLVRLLLQRNARMRVPFERAHLYRTLLDFAFSMSIDAVVAVFIDFYAKGRHKDGLTPAEALTIALGRSRRDIAQLILNRWLFLPGVANIECGIYGTTLCAACASGSIDMVKKALALTSPEYYKGTREKTGTPFQWVMRGGFKDLASEKIIAVLKLLEAYLTRAGQSMLAQDCLATAIPDAVNSLVSLEVIDYMIKSDSPTGLLAAGVDGRSPLSTAIFRARDWEERLICAVDKSSPARTRPVDNSFRADTWPAWIFRIPDRWGLNLLHYAVLSKSTDTFKRLLERIKESRHA